MNKQFLSFLLILVVIFSCATPVAATEENNTIKIEDMAKKLINLGILTGYEDGSLKLDQPITRAEVSTLAIKLIGLEEEAEMEAPMTASFEDVSFRHWAHPYISKAKQKGLVSGYPDGNFKPSNNISIAEGSMVVVNILGYQNQMSYYWPYGPYMKAKDLNIYTEKVDPDKIATRGDIVKMIYNSLEVEKLDKRGNKTGETILKEDLKVKNIEGIVEKTMFNDNRLKKNQISINGEIYSLDNDLDAKSFLGQNLEIQISKNLKVINFNKVGNKSKTIQSRVSSIKSNSLRIQSNNTYYEISKEITVVKNGELIEFNKLRNGDTGTFVIDSNSKLLYVEVFAYDRENLIIGEIDEDNDYIIVYDKNAESSKIRFDRYDEVVAFKDGQSISINNLSRGDVLNISTEGRDKISLFSFDRSFIGTIENVNKDEIDIDGTDFKLADKVTYSIDNNKNVERFSYSKIRMYKTENFTFVTNLDGEIIHMYSELVDLENSSKGILIKKVRDNDIYEFTIYNVEDQNIDTFYYDEDTNEYYTGGTSRISLKAMNEGNNFDYVEFSTNGGHLETIKRIDTVDTEYTANKISGGDLYLLNGEKYDFDNDIPAFDITNIDFKNIEELKSFDLEKMEDAKSLTGLKLKFVFNGIDEDKQIIAIFVTGGLDKVEIEKRSAIILDKDKYQDGNDEYVYEITLFDIDDGGINEILTTKSIYSSLTVGDKVHLRLGFKDEIVSYENISFETKTTSKVTDDYILFEGSDTRYYIDNDAVAFDFDGKNEYNMDEDEILDKIKNIDNIDDGVKIKYYFVEDDGIKEIKLVIID